WAWWPMIAAFAAAEIFVTHLQIRRESYSVSFSEVPMVLGLFFVQPGGLIAARLLGAAAVLIIHRRQHWMKVLFNLSSFAVEVSIAVVTFRAIAGDAAGIGPRLWRASFPTTVAAAFTPSVPVSGPIP